MFIETRPRWHSPAPLGAQGCAPKGARLRDRMALPKSGMAERDKLILGARAPSPAMSAKREAVTASTG
jgi:hypothetical protein